MDLTDEKKLPEVIANKGFGCLNVMFILGSINCPENYTQIVTQLTHTAHKN